MSLDPNVPFIPGISASLEEMIERKEHERIEKIRQEQVATLAFDRLAQGQGTVQEITYDLMEKANRGERPVPIAFVERETASKPQPINLKRFQKGKSKKSGKRRPRH